MGTIKHQHNGSKGSFYYEQDDTKLAEMTYVMVEDHKMIIDHTEVDPSLKGQGIGKKLLAALIDHVRAHRIKVIPLCPFAKATLQKTPEWQDVL